MTTKNFKVKNGIDVGTVENAFHVQDGLLRTKGGNITMGITHANTIDTGSGNLTITSAGGTTTVDDNLTVTGTSDFQTVKVNTIESDDSTAVTINDGLQVNGNFGFNEGGVVSTILDEDNMASDSATALATQQSIKAYVDTEIGALSSVAITEGNTNVTVADSGTGTVTVTVDGATHSVFAAAGITLSQGEFVGTATAAEYADLAERFHADAEYPRGTVMMMGGDHEVTICNVEACENIIGVVSDDAQAGFKMNTSAGTDATHPYIALAGRVDVKVEGDISKGDRLISSGTPGVARAAQPGEATAFNVIGRALEDNDSNEITVIKAFVVANR